MEREPLRPPRSFTGSRYLLPLVVGVVQVGGTFAAAGHEPSRRALDGLALLLLIAGPAALSLRRKYPSQVLIFVIGITGIYIALGYAEGPIFFSCAVAVVSAIMTGHRWIAVASVALGYVAFVWGEYLLGLDARPSFPEAIAVGAWLVALLTVPEMVRVRRRQFAEEMRSRAEERRRQASEERLRIARDLHDVLAHNISMINVQASSALHLLSQKSDRAAPALIAIKDASSEALRELRTVLDLLREGTDGAPRSPTAGLDQLDSLIHRTRAAGVPVEKRVMGEPVELGASVDRAAFRIVQESLTNVARHAGEASAVVKLTYGANELTVEIEDDGRGVVSEPSTGGSGLAGMRERVAAVGGRFLTQPRSQGGGFLVRATLPYV
jgi:signal transduction histidine kinase